MSRAAAEARRRARRTRAVAGMALAALLASACVSEGDAGLTVQALSTDVAFGVAVDDPAGPATPSPTTPLPDTAAIGGFDITESSVTSATMPGTTPTEPPIVAPEECPEPGRGAVAKRILEPNVTELPAEGLYTWKRDGQQVVTDPDTGESRVVSVGGFEKRLVREVTQVSDTVFTYQVVAPLLDRPAVSITTFKVDTAPQQARVGEGVGFVEPVRVNDPEGGLAITSVEIEEGGNRTGAFQPTTGLLLLGLPVVIGEQFSSAAVDLRSGESISQEAQITGVERVDACGEVVDGYLVESTQVRSVESDPVSYSYIVANQYGALVIQETTTLTAIDGDSISVTYSIAQLEPDPIPEAGP